ncbi:11256_t:CDS:2, partial [Gigaspora rosea]
MNEKYKKPSKYDKHHGISDLYLFEYLATLLSPTYTMPFVGESDLITKASIAYRHIVRAVSIGDHIESLVHVLYLGALITTSLPKQLTTLRR